MSVMMTPILAVIAEGADAVSSTPQVPASVLITAIVTLAGVVGYLFRDIRKTLAEERLSSLKAEKERAEERTAWAQERTQLMASADKLEAGLRLEHEVKFRELIARYDDIRRRDYEDNRRHEDQVRKEFADIMDKVSAKDGEASQAMVEMLQKLQDRLLGHR